MTNRQTAARAIAAVRAAVASTAIVSAIGLSLAHAAYADTPAAPGPYSMLKRTQVGGDGGFDYVYADSDNRRLYVARTGQAPRITVFDLDKLTQTGEIPATRAHGVVVDAKSNHGFASSKPVTMFDATTLSVIKTIDVDGNPDGMLHDPFNHRVYILSHSAPNVTVLDGASGAILGTIDIGGAPEQAVTDGKGHIYIDIEDQGAVAVIDAAAMKMTGTYSLNGKGAGNAGLAIDAKNGVLFVACRNPQAMVIISATDGKYITELPIGRGCDGALFNPETLECFSSQGDGTLTVIKESSPTSFAVEQTVTTMTSAKTSTLDRKTGKIFLIAAEYGPAPAADPGQRPRRGPLVPGSFSVLTVGK